MHNINNKPIPDTQLSEGLDRQNLVRIQKRFSELNSIRYTRMRTALNTQQQLCLDAIGLLLHTNHPMMPGFVDRHTPRGVANFEQDKQQVSLGQKIAKSFTFTATPDHIRDIEGIYAMGSVGTIAQSANSDLDIWLCHTPKLCDSELNQLNTKCEKISEWALSHKLEVHFFLMNAESFQNGTLSSLDEESSGSAQKILLLDEFYRTAIFIAGKTPLWWQVPASAEKHYYQYAQTLLDNRFISHRRVLDFGGIAHIPSGEFVGAGIWQLYKAIDSPYKSVLKLLLLEAYASEYPNISPLSLLFKKMVYAGTTDANDLDGYLIIYRYIEKYLIDKKQESRLELVRRSLYFKINIALSMRKSSRYKSWQGKLLLKMIREWNWSEQDIRFLDNRKNWKASDVAAERSLLVKELNHSYHFLINFGNHTQENRMISTTEITVLGRKLQAAFEKRPGKIEWINPGISKDLSETVIYISCDTDELNEHYLWTATSVDQTHNDFDKGDNYNTASALKTSASIVETLLWCLYNGIITKDTRIEIEQPTTITNVDVTKIISSLISWLPDPKANISHDKFEKKSYSKKVLIFINAATNPLYELQNNGFYRLSNMTDPLSYSGFETNLVMSVDIVIQNSWNEINTRRFVGETSLIDALEEYLQLSIPGSQHLPPSITIECVGHTLKKAISERVLTWFDDIIYSFYHDKEQTNPRYIFKMGKKYYCLQYNNSQFVISTFSKKSLLVDHLSHSQKSPSTITLDRTAFNDHVLKSILRHQKNDAVQVFYYRLDIGLEVYVLDEKNSFYHSKIQGNHQNKPLACLHQFLKVVGNRSSHLHEAMLEKPFDIEFYEVIKTHSFFRCQEKVISSTQPTSALFDVKAVAHEVNKKIVFDYHCDNQEFSAISFNDQLELVVAQFIVSRRGSNQHYPIHINDLDLSLCMNKISDNGMLQTIHYLKIKALLEHKLNHAISVLSKG